MRKLSILFLIFAIFIATILTTACPRQTDVQAASRASFELSGLTLDTVRAVDAAFRQKLIDNNQYTEFNRVLNSLAKGGSAFNSLIKQLNAQNQTGKLQKSDLIKLVELFDTSVVNPFLILLTQFKGINNAPALASAIAALRGSILIIASALNKRQNVENEINQISFNSFNSKERTLIYV